MASATRFYASEEQSRDALSKANEVRTNRALLKDALRARRVSLDIYLQSPPWWLKTAQIGEVLRWQPRWGKLKRVPDVLRRSNVSYERKIGALTQRQVRDLVAEIQRRGVTPE